MKRALDDCGTEIFGWNASKNDFSLSLRVWKVTNWPSRRYGAILRNRFRSKLCQPSTESCRPAGDRFSIISVMRLFDWLVDDFTLSNPFEISNKISVSSVHKRQINELASQGLNLRSSLKCVKQPVSRLRSTAKSIMCWNEVCNFNLTAWGC